MKTHRHRVLFIVLILALILAIFYVKNEYDDYYLEKSEAAVYLRAQMVKRVKNVNIQYLSQRDDKEKSLGRDIYRQALAETGAGDEGDYLHYHLSRVMMKMDRERVFANYDKYTLDYTISYRSTRKEEEAVTKQVKEIERAAPQTTYGKIQYFNQYIVDHVAYERSNDPKKYTAYGALIKGRAVCQGYTLLMYRFLRDTKVPARIITGQAIQSGKRAKHAWNIVKLGNLYYDMDVTWNDSLPVNRYFLRGDLSFARTHQQEKQYDDAFWKSYPLSQYDY